MSGSQSYLKQLGIDVNEEEAAESNNAVTYVPSKQAVDATAEADFTTGPELIESPIEKGVGDPAIAEQAAMVKAEAVAAMRADADVSLGEASIAKPPKDPSLQSEPYILPLSETGDFDSSRFKRINELAAEQDGTFDYFNKAASDKIGYEGQLLLGFSDNLSQVSSGIEKIVGAGNYKVFEDKKADFLVNRFYVSVKDEEGNWSPFANPTQDALDMAAKYFPMVGYEVASDVAAVGASFLTSAVVSTLTPFLSYITGPVSLGYSLYAYNKGAERGRQYIQEALGLNEKDAKEFGTLFEEVYKLALDPKAYSAIKKLFGGDSKISSDELKQEIRGVAGGAFAFIPALFDKLAIMSSRIRESASIKDTEIFESSLKAERFVDKAPGLGGKDANLVSTMLPQRTMNKKIQRLAGIIDQTSGKISAVLRDQMISVRNYSERFKGQFGKGDFNSFKSAMGGIYKTIAGIKSGKVTINPEKLGINLREVEDLFFSFRMDESRGMYNNIFEQLGDSSFNLENLRKIIVKREVNTIEPGSKQTAGVAIEPKVGPAVTGEPRVDSIISNLYQLGVQSGGTRVLSKDSIAKAVEQLKANHPDYAKYMDGNKIVIRTPAELLHNYATLLGGMSKGIFARDTGTAVNPQLASFTQSLRNILLDTIANPIPNKKVGKLNLTKELNDAKAFYKQTFDTMGSLPQVEARIASKTGGEEALLPDFLGITEASKGAKGRTKVLLDNIRFQENYLRENLKGGALKSAPLGKLQQAFADVISFKMSGAGSASLTKTQSASDVKAYIGSYTKEERLRLGITPEIEKRIYKDLDLISKVDEIQVFQRYKLGDRIDNAELKDVFASAILKADDLGFKQDIDVMLKVINRLPSKAKKEGLKNLQGGLVDYIFSKESGVLVQITEKNATFAQIGDITIDPTALSKVVDKFEKAGVFKNILTDKVKNSAGKEFTQLEILRGMENYTGVIKQAGADAGSALSGAQLIGQLFTLDPTKFVSAMARISAQGRVAKLFANKAFADALTGMATPKSTTTLGRIAERQKQYFFGKASLANIVAQFAVSTASEYNRSVDAASNQTQEMLNMDNSNSGAASYLRQMEQLQVQ